MDHDMPAPLVSCDLSTYVVRAESKTWFYIIMIWGVQSEKAKITNVFT